MHEWGEPTLRVSLLPKDTNAYGSIFGGVILAHLDTAGALEARKLGPKRFVTVELRKVTFLAPVYVGDVVSYYTRMVRVGRTSATVQVRVEAQRDDRALTVVLVTEAEMVFVNVGADGHPVPIDVHTEATPITGSGGDA